jgi:Uma2 family endonuclease
MREPAVRRMTVDELLDWEDGTDTRYELVDGQPVAMASATPELNEIALAIALALTSRIPANCRVIPNQAVRRTNDYWRSYVLVPCEPRDKSKKAIEAPRLIVEVLSPSTASNDHGDKFDFYRAIPTVEEILFVASTTQRIEAWRRVDGEWHAQLLGKGAVLHLAVSDTPIPLDEIYGNVLD